jgi:hypothetical protein
MVRRGTSTSTRYLVPVRRISVPSNRVSAAVAQCRILIYTRIKIAQGDTVYKNFEIEERYDYTKTFHSYTYTVGNP